METLKRTKIKDLLAAKPGAEVLAKGWVRTKRGNKQVKFIALNDGSTINNIQIVANAELFDEELFKKVTTGASLCVRGKLVESMGSGQAVEIQATDIQVLGECDPMRFPLQKKDTTLEYLRSVAHMRLRTNTFGAVLRIRNQMAYAIHTFFNQKGFVYLHTPLITESDAEGAGDMFQVTTLDLKNTPLDKKGNVDFSKDFFGKKTSLTVSGQLEGELGATAVGEIYTFGPTFRAENSNTPRHLAEFWMIEPEMAFYDINDNMDLAEEMLKYLIQYALDNNMDDLQFLSKRLQDEEKGKKEEEKSMELISKLHFVLEHEFVRLTYTEAIDILRNSNYNKKGKFQYPVDGLGRRPAVGARALPRREALQEACHPDRLPEGDQGLLHEAKRRRQDRPRHGRALPWHRRDHRRLRA
jgi:asparaginyl-tRNA synthetase